MKQFSLQPDYHEVLLAALLLRNQCGGDAWVFHEIILGGHPGDIQEYLSGN